MTIEELKKIFKDVDESKKQIIESMFQDFIYEQEQLEKLKPQLESIGIPASKKEAEKKRYLTKEYVDISQRHDSKIKIFLSVLQKEEGKGDSPLAKLLKSYE